MYHLLLSPHADDVVASCGGIIAQLVAAGVGVTIHTIFCSPVPPPYSPGAVELHKLWGDPQDAVRLRRAEDEAAAARLGVQLCHGNFAEAIYRRDPQGDWLYPEVERIFGVRHPHDEALVSELAHEIEMSFDLSNTRIYVPLGIGSHVDHRLVFEAGNSYRKAGHDVIFYEDFPYAAKQLNHAQQTASSEKLRAATVTLSEDDLLAKIEAFSYYRSQIDMLFGDNNAMLSAFIDYARSVAGRDGRFGERYWIDQQRYDRFP